VEEPGKYVSSCMMRLKASPMFELSSDEMSRWNRSVSETNTPSKWRLITSADSSCSYLTGSLSITASQVLRHGRW
jgi:hypothetical protein